jgi:uncharacterized membrane protein YphA (DoxX/SURF4 family)
MLKLFKFLLRLFPGLFSVLFGLLKFGGQFTNYSGTVKDIESVNSPDMVFLFFHHSGPYIYIIAIAQILGGILLIFKKTSMFGALLCLIIFTNVMIINYSFHFNFTLVIFIAFLNLSYLATLLFEYKRFKKLLIYKNEN